MKNLSAHTLLLTIALLFALVKSVAAQDGVVVVANINNEKIKLTRLQVRNLFMGTALSYDLNVVTLPSDNKTRVIFNTKVVGLTESRIQSYWAQMRFSGRKKPPSELSDEKIILDYLLHNEGSVSYLPNNIDIPERLTVLYKTD